MFVDYDLIPDLETGLNERSRQIVSHLYKSKCYADAPFTTAAALIDELSWKNRVFAHEYEAALPLLAQPFMLNLPPLAAKGPIGSWACQCEGSLYEVRLNDLGCYLAENAQELPFPFLLVNGSLYAESGASAIPPHNIADIARCVRAFLEDPDLSDARFLDCITGPDLPGGGTVLWNDALKQFYLTGEGKMTVRPHLLEVDLHGRKAVLISELPYLMDSHAASHLIVKRARDQTLLQDLWDNAYDVIELFAFPQKEVDASVLMAWLDKVLRKTYPLKCVVLKEDNMEKLSYKALMKTYVERCLEHVSADTLSRSLSVLCERFAWERRTVIER